MATSTEGPSGFSQEEIFAQLKKIQEQEDAIYGKQMGLPFANVIKDQVAPEDSGFDADVESLADNSEDPKLCKKLFYRMMAVINSNIPKGQVRDFVNSEKKLYLKCTSQTTDSRFSFKNSLNTLMDIVDEWQRLDSNGFDLGAAFYELNEKHGYHNTKIIKAAQSPFDAVLKGLLNTPPPKKDKNKKESE